MAYSDPDPEVQRVRYEIRRFRQHFITYVAVIGVLFVINAVTGGFWFGHWWFFWIALIWGVILALEAAHLFGEDIGREWENRMVDQVVARRRRQATGAPPPAYTPPEPPRPPAPNVYRPPPDSSGVPPAIASDSAPQSPPAPPVA
jgi:2TM domain